MPGVSFHGAVTSGHSGPFPPTTLIATAGSVFVNGKPILRVGDSIVPHTRQRKPYDTHGGVVTTGSGSIYAEGIAVAGIGSNISCGDTVSQASPNVSSN